MSAGVTAIRDRLRTAILSGELGPDNVSTQNQLADSLGVSRTPLREALRMLELEGLVVRETNRRFRIAGFSLDDLEGLYVMRLSLETSALQLTLPTFTHTDHAELEGLFAQMERFAHVGDWAGFEEPHCLFHQRMAQGAGERVIEQVRLLWGHAARYRNAYAVIVDNGEPDVWALRRAEHRALLDAVEDGDLDRAVVLQASHYARTALDIAAKVDPNHGMERLRTILEAQTGSREVVSV
jgi:GntR family transcriptional regulator, rspAB operon transcriptional repressor